AAGPGDGAGAVVAAAHGRGGAGAHRGRAAGRTAVRRLERVGAAPLRAVHPVVAVVADRPAQVAGRHLGDLDGGAGAAVPADAALPALLVVRGRGGRVPAGRRRVVRVPGGGRTAVQQGPLAARRPAAQRAAGDGRTRRRPGDGRAGRRR